MAPSFDCCIKASFHKGNAVGQESKLAGRNVYVTGPETADKAIMIIADVWGWSLINTRLVADKYAQAVGARVYLPDFFDGQDLNTMLKNNPGKNPGDFVPDQLKNFPPRNWDVFPPVVDAIRQSQPSAKKVGAIGFCWGGTGCLFLGSSKAGKSQVDAVAFAHPSLIEASDFEMNERSGLFMCCQHDQMFPKEKQEAAKEVCERLADKNGVFSRFSYYPKVSHGWSIKGDEGQPYEAKAMAHAVTEAISFFSLELAS